MDKLPGDPIDRNTVQHCTHCGGTDHTARAHNDPLAALHCADKLRAAGDLVGAEHWERMALTLAVQVVSR